MCYIVSMKPILPFTQRLTQAEILFQNSVIPHIKECFPGTWFSTEHTPLDYEHGIDYIHVHLHQTTTISARVWQSRPMQHFAIRWKRTGYIEQKLEMDLRLDALAIDGIHSDITIEAFVYQSKVYVAMINTKMLWEHIAQHFDELSCFYVTNPEDRTIFKRVEFDRFHPGDITKIIAKL